MKTFWKKVFIRIIAKNLFNETFRAANEGILAHFEYHRKDLRKALSYCKISEMASYEMFDREFSHLTPNQQIVLSGYTRQEWFDMERTMRQKENQNNICLSQ